MPKLFLALCLVCALPLAAQAKTFKVTDEDKPVSEITIPDDWQTDASDGSVEALSPDTTVYVSAEIFDASDVAEAGRSAVRFLADQKIKVKPESKTQKEAAVAGLPALEISWEATDEDGPTRIRLSVVKVRADKVLLLTYWRSAAAEKAHGAEVDAITSSIKPIK